MTWRHRRPPVSQRLLLDQRPKSATLLTKPFEAGVTGWIVIFGGIIAEVAGGAAVANQPSPAITVPVLMFPVAVAGGFAVVQWWQALSSSAEPASWWHLAGVAAAVLTWLLWPTIPGALAGTEAVPGASGGTAFCRVLPTAAVADCLRRFAQASDSHNLAWWSTGAFIFVAALLARRARIAAWAGIPAAFVGCQLAAYFLNQFILYYHIA